jgi:magnesium transporter
MTTRFDQPVLEFASDDVAKLPAAGTVREALDRIRERGLGERIVYFYVVDAKDRLVGVVPTRRLLTAALDQPLSEVMVRSTVSIPRDATMLDVCHLFAKHRFLALPVLDPDGRILGVVEVGMVSGEVIDVSERDQMREIFETIGVRIAEIRGASPLRAFRLRFPWLTATIASGTICALLVGAYEATLERTLLLAFFLTLVLGLGESVSMQSMTVVLHAMRSKRPTLRWYLAACWREAGTALLLGGACALLVGLIVWIWHGDAPAAGVVGGSLILALTCACLLGLSVPALIHALRLDPRIAAGPATLALADICTIVVYFTLASAIL